MQIKNRQGPANSRFKILSAHFDQEAWAKGEAKKEIWLCKVQIKIHQGPANSRFKILSADFGREAWAKGEAKQEIWS